MKLLLITQKVDIDDPVLGFFHRWIEEFARSVEQVAVICLFEGKYNLPSNVKVLSLGKESGASRLKYIFRFYRYIIFERKNYDCVFVHMNHVYVLLGWKIWKFFGKKIFLWYNHKMGSISTRLAILFSNKVFYTSQFAFSARFKKSVQMPVGIDTNFFNPDANVTPKKHSLLFLGRLSPVKDVDVFINALHILHKRGVSFTASIYGNAEKIDKRYKNKLQNMSNLLRKDEKLSFSNAVPNSETPRIYNQHEIYVNATGQGSFDKTIIEAMACGMIVIACNKNMKGVLNDEQIFKEGDSCDLALKMQTALTLDGDDVAQIKKSLRDNASTKHDLKQLIRTVLTELQA